MPAPALTWEQISRRRLRAQHLHTRVPAGGKPAWSVPEAPVVPSGDAPVVRLLPLFDPYTVAVRRDGERPLAGPEKGRLRVEVRPFAPLDRTVADLAGYEAERLAAYLGVAADITVGGFVAGRARKNLYRSTTRRETPV